MAETPQPEAKPTLVKGLTDNLVNNLKVTNGETTNAPIGRLINQGTATPLQDIPNPAPVKQGK